MFDVAVLPEVNISLLNLLASKECNTLFVEKASEIFKAVFLVEVEAMEVGFSKGEQNVSVPQIFYLGHQQCGLSVNIPFDQLSVSSFLQGQKSANPSLKEFIEEHIALQLVGILRPCFYPQYLSETIFLGQGSGEIFTQEESVVASFRVGNGRESFVFQFGFFIPNKLAPSEDLKGLVEFPFDLSKIEVERNGKKTINFDVYLGILHIPPASLVDMLSSGSRINLPTSLSPHSCLLLMGRETYFSGDFMSYQRGNAFYLRELLPESPFIAKSGYSSVALRLSSGSITTVELPLKYPYLPINSKWNGEIEILIGGEIVSRGQIGEDESGLFVIVC